MFCFDILLLKYDTVVEQQNSTKFHNQLNFLHTSIVYFVS